jgi:hypothetical protein
MSQESGQGDKKGHSVLLRKGSSSKMALKEKIVIIYEAFFQVRNPNNNEPFSKVIFNLLRIIS